MSVFGQINEFAARPGWWARVARFFVPLALLSLLLCSWLYHTERASAVDRVAAGAQEDLEGIRRELALAINDGAIDTVRLANDHDLMDLMARSEDTWSSFSDDLLTLLQTKPVYDKARLLDLTGEERLRINLNGGNPIVVPAAELQNKRGRDFFESTRNLPRGRVYVSPLNLNVERGRVQVPYVPTLRVATPAFDAGGMRRGVIVLNMLGNHLFDRLQQVAPAGSELWMLDGKGEWLLGGRSEDGFSLDTGHGELLKQRDAELSAAIDQAASGRLLRDDGLWVYSQFNPLEGDARRMLGVLAIPLVGSEEGLRWRLVLHYDDAALEPTVGPALRLVGLFALGTVLLSFMAAVLLAVQSERGEARQRAESAFFRMFERAPVGTMVLDASGNGLFFNAYWESLSGLTAEASQGQGWRTVLDEGDCARIDAALRETDETCEQHCELRLRRADGQMRWASFQIAAIPIEGMRERRYIIGVADVEDRKHAELRTNAALQLLEGVVAGSGDPIVAIDKHYNIILANPAFGQAFGMLYGDAPGVGDNLLEWLNGRPNDKQNLLTHFGHAMQGMGGHARLSLGPAKRLFDCAFSPLYGAVGEPSGAILFASDVTEIAKVQAKVARNEELFRAVFAGSLDAVFVMEAVRDASGDIADFRYVEVSGPPISRGGRRRDDFVGWLVTERNPVFSKELGYLEHSRKVIETGQPFIEEIYYEHDDVPAGWYEMRIVSLGWGVTLTARNITARKEAELALIASESLQRNIFDCSPYMIAATDQTGRISVFNRAGEAMLGYSADELIGLQTPLIFHDAQSLVRVADLLSREQGCTIEPNADVFELLTADGPDTREWTFVTKQGKRIPVILTATSRYDAEGRRLGTMGIAYDISEQKAIEEQRDRLFAVVEALPDAVTMATPEGTLLYVNPAARRLRDIAADEPLDKVDVRRGYSDWAISLTRNVAVPQALSGRPWLGDTQWIRADGTVVDTRQLFVAPSMNGRPPTFVASIVHDLSEIRAMEAKMVEEDALLNSILESVQDAIVVIDEAGMVQNVNPAVSDVFGYGLHRVMGKPITMLMPESYIESHLTAFTRYIATGEASGKVIGHRLEVPGRRHDGTHFPMELTVSEIRMGGQRLFTGVMRDISERKAFEERLLENIDELRAMQDALNSANEQLLSANVELNRMAQLDGLTGVANRRAFDQTLKQEWERAARANRPLALLMVDVDHFKKYNDGYGHQAGDECLKQVAQILRGALERPGDFAARYGGEEFALILPDTDAAGARGVAKRMRDAVHERAIAHAYSPTASHVTFSVGVAAVVPLHGVPAEILVTNADKALYRAKDEGRDRAVVAGEG